MRTELSAGDGALAIDAVAPTSERLALVQDVIGRDLECFGRRDELSVVFEPAA